jgi:hypothetical protein
VDIFAALRGMVETFARRASGWTPTERVAMPDVTAKSDNGRSDAREAQR